MCLLGDGIFKESLTWLLWLKDCHKIGADANAVTKEVFDDQGIPKLNINAEAKTEKMLKLQKIPFQLQARGFMHFTPLRWYAGGHEEPEDSLNMLVSYEEAAQPLLTRRVRARAADLFFSN